METNLNKNISVWRGNNTPPTDYHLWEKTDGSIHTKIDNSWLQLTSPTDKNTLDRIADKLNNLQMKEVEVSNSNILKSYQLKSNDESFGVVIDIPKDKSLKDVKLGYENASVNSETGEINIGTPSEIETKAQYMIYSMAVADGTFTMVKVNLSNFISEKEYSDGLEVEGSKLKVKKDPSSETYLSISPNGVKISGIDSKLANINKVLYNQHSKVILDGKPSIIEKGINTQITMSWRYIYNDEEVTPESMQLKSGSNVLESTNKKYTDTISDSKSYQVVAVNQGITKYSNTFTVNAYYPMYFGEGGESFDKTSIITASNKRPISYSPNGDVSITFTGGKYLWLCVPNTMSVNKVTSGGFAVPMEAPTNETVNGTYKCYRSTDTINKGTVKFTIL